MTAKFLAAKILGGVDGISDVIHFVTNSRRPITKGEVVTNSFLDKREWARLDERIVAMVKLRLNGVTDLRQRNLVRMTTLAEMLSQWRVASERVAASVNMDGRSVAQRDSVDKKVYGVPVPIIRADYTIGRRELLASRAAGAPIDVTEASEAGASVAETAENILFNGAPNITVNGNGVFGYTTLAARTTNTAAGFGGGDFGTVSNIQPTFLGMISALAAKRYHGPFGCYIAPAQYIQMLSTYTDGSGQTALDRVESLPQIEFIKPADMLADGALTMVQLTPDVVELVVGLELDNREWESPDGSELHFAVMMAAAPKLVTDYSGNAGIAHATAC